MFLVGALGQAEKEEKDKSGKSPKISGKSPKPKKRSLSQKDREGRTSPDWETPPFEHHPSSGP